MPTQKFILPAFRLVSYVAIKEGRSNLDKNRLVSKAKFDGFCALDVKSKMHHVAVLNDVILAF